MKKERLVEIVGQQNVLDSDAVLAEYSQDLSFIPTNQPDLVVKPGNSDQVQQIVRDAYEAKTPLIPVSSGAPHFRGSTVPELGGVVMDMSGMNQIRKIDRVDRVAMIEPGVRFGELQQELKKEGMRLPMPLCPHENKSVVGSCLEREPHIMPKYHLDHSDPLLCNEVVFGTGDIFRTGEASGPGTIEEQHEVQRNQKVSMGIQMNVNRIIQGSQGSFGIVTWSTVKCEILPQIKRPFLVAAQNPDKLIELGHWLVRLRLAGELFLLNSGNFARLVADNEADVARLQEELPTWILFFCVEGYENFPEERVAYQIKDINEIAQKLGLTLYEVYKKIAAVDVMGRIELPSSSSYWKQKNTGGCQDIPFISSYDRLSLYYDTMIEQAVGHGFPLRNLGVHIQPVCQGHGHHCEFSLFYDPESSTERRKTKELYLSVGKALLDRGAFFSRPYDLLAEQVVNRDAASKNALEKLKKIFDPQNIMNPGKLCY